ncbi:MAG: nicotinate (nicotinamide) nucleotide adenylyltransferase [Pseudomonadota bacterium]
MSSTANLQKIGILGGTFDPPHLGHLRIAQAAMDRFNLQSIYFVPCYQSPTGKQPIASPAQRFEMLQRMLQGHPTFKADNRELTRQGISYTIDTLKSYRAEYPDTPLYLIIGSDNFETFETWRAYEKILEEVNLIVVNRRTKNFERHLKGKILHLPIPFIDISATDIRQKIKNNLDVENSLAKSVYHYIQRNHLYL